VLPFDVSPAAVILIAVGAVVGLLGLRGLGRWLLGPVFALEISRLARNGRTNLIRVGYASALFIALYAEFPVVRELSREQAAEFAKQFAELYLFIQSVAVLLITPIYFGGAVSDEKEKRSLDFLLGTRLTAREIVLGKFAARFLSLLSVLMTGLPVMALIMLWGGVDATTVLVMFAAAVIGIASLGSVSLFLSVNMRRTFFAVLVAYVFALFFLLISFWPYFWFASPVGLLRVLSVNDDPSWGAVMTPVSPLDQLRDFALLHCIPAAIILVAAVMRLRHQANSLEPPPSWNNEVDRVRFPIPEPPREYVPTMISAQPIRGDALLWRERNLGYLSDPYFDTFWLYYALFLFLLTLASWAVTDPVADSFLNYAFRKPTVITAAGLCLVLLLRLAGCVTREREHRTLESLLALPMSRGRILYVKWLGAVLRSNRWAGALVASFVLGTISGAFRPLEAVLLLVLCFSWAAFVASLTLLVGVFVRSTARAYVVSIVAVVAILTATTFSAQFNDNPHGFLGLARDALAPDRSWGMAAQSRLTTTIALMVAAAVYLAAGVALAAIALWRFRREERYT
jgi:ABC-type transport system involved in multi-copper enzyme maturation permease subunit